MVQYWRYIIPHIGVMKLNVHKLCGSKLKLYNTTKNINITTQIFTYKNSCMFDAKIQKSDNNSNFKKYKNIQSNLPLHGTNYCIYNTHTSVY